MIRKFLVAYHLFICLIAVAAGFLLIQHFWMDSVLAKIIGERWNMHLACDGARLDNLSQISLETLRVVSAKGEVLAAFKNGRIRISPVFFWGNDAEADFDSLTLQRYFFEGLPRFFSPIYHLTKKSLVAKPVRFVARKRGAKLFLHLAPLECNTVRLHGGLLFDEGHLTKAHLILYLSAKPGTRLLRDLFARMAPQRDGTRKARLVLSNHALTIYGRTEPLFKADWVYSK